MKGHGARFLVRALGLLVLLSLILAMAGCGGGGGGGGDPDAIALMKKLPQGAANFMFVDIKTMRTDTDLKDLYSSFSGSIGDMGGVTAMSPADLDFFAAGGDVYMMQGNVDLAKLRQYLKDSGFDQSDYQGIEMWEAMTYGMAVDGNTIIAGTTTDLEDCIDAIKGKAKSFYDDSKIKGDISKLPSNGLMVIWGTSTQTVLGEDGNYAGLEAVAASVAKKDAKTGTATIIMRFKDSASAGAALNQVKSDAETYGTIKFTDLKVTQDGQFVKVTGNVPLDATLFE